jgi:uncharacterized membrane protein (GlpM family)
MEQLFIIQLIIAFIIGGGFIALLSFIAEKVNKKIAGTIGYLFFILISHLLLKRKDYSKPISLNYTTFQKILRATFVGFIIFIVVLLSKTLNPFWGGMFSMFPAAFSSVIIILHWHYGTKSLFPTMQNAALGSISLFGYAIAAMFLFPIFGYVFGTIISYLISLIITLVLIYIQNKN